MFGMFRNEKSAASDKISLSDELIKYIERKQFYFVATKTEYKLGVAGGKCWNELRCIIGYNLMFDTEVIMKSDNEYTPAFIFERNHYGPSKPRFRLEFNAPEDVVVPLAGYLRTKPRNEVVGVTIRFSEQNDEFLYKDIELSSFLDTAPPEYMHLGVGPNALRESLSKTHSW